MRGYPFADTLSFWNKVKCLSEPEIESTTRYISLKLIRAMIAKENGDRDYTLSEIGRMF